MAKETCLIPEAVDKHVGKEGQSNLLIFRSCVPNKTEKRLQEKIDHYPSVFVSLFCPLNGTRNRRLDQPPGST